MKMKKMSIEEYREYHKTQKDKKLMCETNIRKWHDKEIGKCNELLKEGFEPSENYFKIRGWGKYTPLT
jgi:hypothetical protein